MITQRYFDEQWGRLGNPDLSARPAVRGGATARVSLLSSADRRIDMGMLSISMSPSRVRSAPTASMRSMGRVPTIPVSSSSRMETCYSGYFPVIPVSRGVQGRVAGRFLRFNVRYRAQAEAALFACRRRYGRRPVASVHVRRGDYVYPGAEDLWGNLARAGYYERAVEAIGDDVTYLVFSDDLEWCRRSLGLPGAVYADFDQFTSLCVMSRCDVNIGRQQQLQLVGGVLEPAGGGVMHRSRWFGPDNDTSERSSGRHRAPSWRTIPVSYRSA